MRNGARYCIGAHLTAKKVLKYRFLRDFAERQNLVRPALH